jgi:hypothetical protein
MKQRKKIELPASADDPAHSLRVKEIAAQAKNQLKNSGEGAAKGQSQFEKFKEAARELECDDDEGRFRERFKKLTEAPSPELAEKRKKR